ncbi:MAG: deoxyribodipyrimidine photo-lyase, partial [Bdellovibrionales bacterium]|nr:deoxyribodipyrimidine photo-lyase [Bdellovibrionales bacterium]
LDRFPHVATGAFKRDLDAIRWPGKPEHFTAWKEGRTGFPLVDAAMRHFNDTGWMHNRLRMVTASFLVKDLLLDWRAGEEHFARNLLDFDLALNNGGWQWCAGTGCDAQPWFRVFNPWLQSRRFDPDGEFIRTYVPELRKVSTRELHRPGAHGNYAPLVDHSTQRDLVLKLFSGMK